MAIPDQLVEKIETLAGARPRSRRKAAVLIEDMEAILQIPERMQAIKAAGASPTKAEFDALVTDVAKINARLVEIAKALQGRLL